ncbi:hypothetical protein AGMMS49957_18030 [Synergistales bacterium]|nr:hypothetical protein AGMMS49957_18030 [Synergistales bacterium]
MKIQLKKALRHKGQDLTELDIQLETLTGVDLIEVEQQLFKSGKVALMPDYSKVYLIRVAARAARIPVEVMETLSARDFTVVTNQVQSFLMGSDSEESAAEPEAKTKATAQPTSSAA